MSHVVPPPPTTQSGIGGTPHEVQPKSQQELEDKKHDDGLDDDDGIDAVEDDTEDSVLQAELDRFLGPMTPAPRTAVRPSTSQSVPAAPNPASALSGEPTKEAVTGGNGEARVYGAGGGTSSAGRDYPGNALEGGIGNGEVEQAAVSQKRPRLLLLVVTYHILIFLFTLQAILIILNSIGPWRNLIYAGSSFGHRFFDHWKFAVWVTSVTCAALCIHLLMAILKIYKPSGFRLRLRTTTTTLPILRVNDVSADPHAPSESIFSHLWDFGQPEVYSRIQTHVLGLFWCFVLFGMFALGLSPGPASYIPWFITLLTFSACAMLYRRAWKIIEIHPTWTYTHICDIDRVTGAGMLRI